MKKIAGLAMVLLAVKANAQLNEGKQSIDKLCGCFNIEFKYAETFSPDPNYKFRDRELMHAKELALPIEKGDKKIVIQHLLVIDDSTVIKHWREDWGYEQTYIWKYVGNKKWVKQELKPEQYKGKWVQTVWEVDDAPRYQGISEWVTTDGKTFWQNTTDAPLPRREYSVRNDYNIMRRGNKLVLTKEGWTHEQDNDKIIKTSNDEKLLVQEKGYNIYQLAKESDCAKAKAWWQTQTQFWSTVRKEWADFFDTQKSIQLQEKMANRTFSSYLDELYNKWHKNELKTEAVASETKSLLQKFVQTADKVTTAKQ